MAKLVPKMSMVWHVLILLAVLLLLVTSWSVAQEGVTASRAPRNQHENKESYRVLYLSLRSGSWPWSLAMFTESRDHLQRITGVPVEMVIENTTIADIDSPAARQAFLTLFRERYTDKIDFIVVRREFSQIDTILEALPSVPLIIADQNLALHREWEVPPVNVHEVRYNIRADRNVRIALQLRPQTQKIIVVTGLDPYDRSLEASTRQQLGTLYHGVEIAYWSGVPVAELKKRVASLSGEHVILFLATTVDKNGTPSVSAKVVKELSEVASVPIFGIADTFMPDGIVGGYVLSSKMSGRRSAEMINQILHGKPLPGITSLEDYGQEQFDWQQMRRWGISKNLISKDAVVLNRPSSFFERNVWILHVLSVVFLLLVLSIIVLLWYLHLRRQAEHALQASEEKFRILLQSMPLPVCLVNKEGVITYMNERFFNVFGYSEQEIPSLAEWWKKAYPDKEYREWVIKNWESAVSRAAQTGVDIEAEVYHVTCKDGDIREIIISGITITKNFLATFIDITERVNAEKSLAESEEKFSKAFNLGPTMLCITRVRDGKFVDYNQAWLAGFEYSKEELDSKTSLELGVWVNPEERDAVTSDLVKGIPFVNREVILKSKSGKIIHCLFSTEIIQINNEAHAVTSLNDITTRKEREQLLRTSEAHLRTLVQTIPDLIWLKNTDGVYLTCNKQFERFFNAREKDIIGKTDYDFVDREVADSFKSNDEKAIAAGKESSNEEWVTFLEDGHRALLETIKTPMYDEKGTLVGVLGIGRDITERKRADKERAELQRRLTQSQKIESIGQLAGGVAHDFNNMLSVILGYGNMLLEKISPDDPLHEYAQEIVNAGTRSATITRQLLAFARKQTIAPRVLDLNETIEEMLKMLRRLIGEDIDLNWHPSSLWPVFIDPSQLDQILANLCVNARDAINGVGKITIETETTCIDEAYCLSHPGFIAGDFVLMSISDDGIGMDSDTIGRIFEPFFTTKEPGEGTGLGLATVYGIVKQNNGFINVYSEPGQGTTFRIYLPRHADLITASEKQKKDEIVQGHGETILVVEDEASILKLTSKILINLGYVVLVASNGKEAVKLAKENDKTLDLLLTDVIMPEMNGRDLSNVLLAINPDLKCLFMSGYTSTVISGKGILEEGMSFIQKPFSARDLGAKVDEVLKS
ncbi:PAS domain S-box protein [Desulforhopalus vacuolatus]|uniref:hybrid sensor histidine kinase/response regulator n=1 Tax=Desulforhopalus vacuolatus TaxID=40414 RepID=UPI0019648688|nr:PAS domain-containing sensor histidine kinase [Desulforhopalus vacuolatus]MBM9521148.1 PAS domain S-box protein [Desulforhopalus vacuolatus]